MPGAVLLAPAILPSYFWDVSLSALRAERSWCWEARRGGLAVDCGDEHATGSAAGAVREGVPEPRKRPRAQAEVQRLLAFRANGFTANPD